MALPLGSEGEELKDIHFVALKWDVYNTLREAFFSKCHRWFVITATIFGLASIASVYDIFFLNTNSAIWHYSFSSDSIAVLFSFIALVFGILGYIFDFTGKAERHKILSHRWDEFVERLEDKKIGKANVKKDDYAQLIKDYNKISRVQRRLVSYRGLEAIADNIITEDYSYDTVIKISRLVYIFRNIRKFRNTEFERVPRISR